MDSELVARTGMFTTYSGHYDGAHISVVSGGSGSPEAELVLHEFLENTAASAYLRLGGSGGMHESVRPGDVVISHGVVRDEGMTQAYVHPSFPAAASPEIVLALAQAGEELGARYHVGITRSSDSDFCGVGRPSVTCSPAGDRRVGRAGHPAAAIRQARRLDLLGCRRRS